MNEQSLSLAHKDCLRSINNLGETIVRNICDGTSTAVPWGTVDWAVGGILSVLTLALLGMLLTLLYHMVTDF